MAAPTLNLVGLQNLLRKHPPQKTAPAPDKTCEVWMPQGDPEIKITHGGLVATDGCITVDATGDGLCITARKRTEHLERGVLFHAGEPTFMLEGLAAIGVALQQFFEEEMEWKRSCLTCGQYEQRGEDDGLCFRNNQPTWDDEYCDKWQDRLAGPD